MEEMGDMGRYRVPPYILMCSMSRSSSTSSGIRQDEMEIDLWRPTSRKAGPM